MLWDDCSYLGICLISIAACSSEEAIEAVFSLHLTPMACVVVKYHTLCMLTRNKINLGLSNQNFSLTSLDVVKSAWICILLRFQKRPNSMLLSIIKSIFGKVNQINTWPVP